MAGRRNANLRYRTSYIRDACLDYFQDRIDVQHKVLFSGIADIKDIGEWKTKVLYIYKTIARGDFEKKIMASALLQGVQERINQGAQYSDGYAMLNYLIDNKICKSDDWVYFDVFSPLIITLAANGHSKACVRLIDECGANPYDKDECGKNLLHLVIAKGHIQHSFVDGIRADQMPLFERAISHSATHTHINDRMFNGCTALHIAAARGQEYYIKKLIEHGADPDITVRLFEMELDAYSIIKLPMAQLQEIMASCFCLPDGWKHRETLKKELATFNQAEHIKPSIAKNNLYDWRREYLFKSNISNTANVSRKEANDDSLHEQDTRAQEYNAVYSPLDISASVSAKSDAAMSQRLAVLPEKLAVVLDFTGQGYAKTPKDLLPIESTSSQPTDYLSKESDGDTATQDLSINVSDSVEPDACVLESLTKGNTPIPHSQIDIQPVNILYTGSVSSQSTDILHTSLAEEEHQDIRAAYALPNITSSDNLESGADVFHESSVLDIAQKESNSSLLRTKQDTRTPRDVITINDSSIKLINKKYSMADHRPDIATSDNVGFDVAMLSQMLEVLPEKHDAHVAMLDAGEQTSSDDMPDWKNFRNFIDRAKSAGSGLESNIFVENYCPQIHEPIEQLLITYDGDENAAFETITNHVNQLLENVSSTVEKSCVITAIWRAAVPLGTVGCNSYYEALQNDPVFAMKMRLVDWLITSKICSIDTRFAYSSAYSQNTALMWSIANGACRFATELMNKYDADPALQDEWGKTVLHLLFAKGHFDISSDDEREDQWPLVEAILKRDDIVSFINTQDDYGNTALHYSCTLGSDDKYIKALIRAGADIAIRNKDKQLPMDLLFFSKRDKLFVRALGLGKVIKTNDTEQIIEGEIKNVATIFTSSGSAESSMAISKKSQALLAISAFSLAVCVPCAVCAAILFPLAAPAMVVLACAATIAGLLGAFMCICGAVYHRLAEINDHNIESQPISSVNESVVGTLCADVVNNASEPQTDIVIGVGNVVGTSHNASRALM